MEFRAGQFMYYELGSLAFPDDRGTHRHFTISCSPTDKDVVLFATRMRSAIIMLMYFKLMKTQIETECLVFC